MAQRSRATGGLPPGTPYPHARRARRAVRAHRRLGAKLHGSPTVTADSDICYARDRHDLDRLAMALAGLEVPVASLDALVRMKRAAGRPKDVIEAEVLEALREETQGSGH